MSNNNYGEKWRPQFHFTPEKNWMNDPNGKVFYDGEYHLFYQYNPFGSQWGHMSWGHAVSRDLLRWEHLPVALYEEDGVMIFSGCVVVDEKNASGLGTGDVPPFIAIYTGNQPEDHRQFQCLAYSNDRGRTWTKYQGNPIIDLDKRDFRDPKVFWYAPDQRWIMAVALSAEHKIRFYYSHNLIDWEHLSDFGPAGSVGGLWECPDLFPLSVQGDGETVKWVLSVDILTGGLYGGSGAQYFVGHFDGKTFTMEDDQPAMVNTPDIVLADFEGDYAGWIRSGDAFGETPVAGTLPNQNQVLNYQGQKLVNSFFQGDKTTGLLISSEFVFERDYLNFLIGGGYLPEKAGMRLKVNGEIVYSATAVGMCGLWFRRSEPRSASGMSGPRALRDSGALSPRPAHELWNPGGALRVARGGGGSSFPGLPGRRNALDRGGRASVVFCGGAVGLDSGSHVDRSPHPLEPQRRLCLVGSCFAVSAIPTDSRWVFSTVGFPAGLSMPGSPRRRHPAGSSTGADHDRVRVGTVPVLSFWLWEPPGFRFTGGFAGSGSAQGFSSSSLCSWSRVGLRPAGGSVTSVSVSSSSTRSYWWSPNDTLPQMFRRTREVATGAGGEADRAGVRGSECRHCGLPVPRGRLDRGDDFCCEGCRRVYELIQSSDLSAFYEMSPTRGLPAAAKPDQTRSPGSSGCCRKARQG